MKSPWYLFSIFPLVAFSYCGEDDLFYIADQKEEAWLQIVSDKSSDFDEELSKTLGAIEMDDEDAEGLSLFGLGQEEQIEPLLPWSVEDLANEEISTYVEKRAKETHEEYDEAFTEQEKSYEPSLERVPQRRSPVFARSKALPSDSKEKQVSEKMAPPSKKQTMQSSSPDQKKRPPIARKRSQRRKVHAKPASRKRRMMTNQKNMSKETTSPTAKTQN